MIERKGAMQGPGTSKLAQFLAFPLLEPLREKPFRRLWVGGTLSMVADQAFLVALTWLVLRITGSGATLGVVLAVAAVPGTVLMPLGGVLSDRFSPTPLLVVANAGRAVLLGVLAILVLADVTRLWQVYALAAGLSALDALYYPASMAAVPALVDRERLGSANALTQGAEQTSGIFGPALAGFSLALFGLGVSFAVIGLLCLAATAVFAAVARSVGPPPEEAGESGPEEEQEGGGAGSGDGAVSQLLEGVRYAWGDPVIRTVLLILVGINLAMMGPLYVGGATLAEGRFGGAGAFGVLVGAAGVGSLAGAGAAGWVAHPARKGLALLAGTTAMGLIVGAFAFAGNLLVGTALALGVGAVAGFFGVINISWLQERSRPELTGRVMSLVMFAAVSLDPISFALAGLLVELNLATVFLAAGALLLLTAALGATNKSFRNAT